MLPHLLSSVVLIGGCSASLFLAATALREGRNAWIWIVLAVAFMALAVSVIG